MREDQRPGRWDKGRVETFSDGVFAIAITLLVLDISVPSDLHHLSSALEHEWPAYLAHVTSFLTVWGVWVSHHRVFSRLGSLDSRMMQINLVLLLTTAFLPFPTKILAESLRASDATAQTAVILYGGTVLAIELVLVAAAMYADSSPELLRSRPADGSDVTAEPVRRRLLSTTILLYALALFIALIDFPKIAAVLYLALGVRAAALPEHDRRHLWFSLRRGKDVSAGSTGGG